MASQLNEHVIYNKLDDTNQSAFKFSLWTKTAIKNEVHFALARGESTAVVLLDQSAAFEVIDRSTLIHCLSSWFGIGGVVLDWFKSYLSDGSQCIKIGTILSEAKILFYGVPLGSVLGPILFLLHTSLLSKVIQNHSGLSFYFYAYDTELYVHLTQLDDVRKLLSANKLQLNLDKMEIIMFSSKTGHAKLNEFF